jgi:hypothetical protein
MAVGLARVDGSWRAVVVAIVPLVITSILCEALMVMLGIGVNAGQRARSKAMRIGSKRPRWRWRERGDEAIKGRAPAAPVRGTVGLEGR